MIGLVVSGLSVDFADFFVIGVDILDICIIDLFQQTVSLLLFADRSIDLIFGQLDHKRLTGQSMGVTSLTNQGHLMMGSNLFASCILLPFSFFLNPLMLYI